MSLPQSEKNRKMKNEKLKKGKAKINFGDITKNHSLSIDKEACGRKLNCQMAGGRRKWRWEKKENVQRKSSEFGTHTRTQIEGCEAN